MQAGMLIIIAHKGDAKMKCIIPAAGYATRLYPLTKNYPKALLRIGNKTILDRICDDLYENCSTKDFNVISNHKFVGNFHKWAQYKNYEVSVVDDGTSSNSERHGVVGALCFAYDECYIEDDCFVVASDFYFSFSLKKFITFAENANESCVLSNSGNVLAYYIKSQDFVEISKVFSNSNDRDDIDKLSEWLVSERNAKTFEIAEKYYDINTEEDFLTLKREVEGEYIGTFDRKLDKALIPTCNIMGVDIASIDMDWLLDFTHENIEDLSGDYMCVSNVHTTVTAYEDAVYCNIQNGGVLAIPDGGPLSTVARRRGYRAMKRTTGPSYMGEILDESKERGYKHFFFGSTPETLEKLKARLDNDYPDLEVVGMFSPPFRQTTEEEDAEIVKMINEAKADFIWVGLGAPKQERWMAEHLGKVHGFMIGVGAGFDYLAGNIRRAPEWMQNRNLEWLFRLFQDPKRLFRRYLTTNTKFIVEAVLKGK